MAEFDQIKMENEDREQPWNFHTCKFCPYRSKSTFVMCKHIRLHRRKSDNDTFICDSKTPEMFDCEYCEFETNLKVDLTEHLRVFHDGKDVNEELENIFECNRCKNCGFETYSVLMFTKHVDECNDTFINTKHETVHDKNEFCTVGSGKSTERVKWHKGDQCDYRSPGKHGKETHVLSKYTTSREKSNWFECEHCTYKSRTKHDLKRHNGRKHSVSQDINWTDPEDIVWFKCAQCMYKGKRKTNLENHVMRNHLSPDDINWAKCNRCAHKAKTKTDLKRHILSKHTNPEDIVWFECAQCMYKAKRKSHLEDHMLRNHMKGINWTKCEQCAYKCKIKRDLKKHIRRMH